MNGRGIPPCHGFPGLGETRLREQYPYRHCEPCGGPSPRSWLEICRRPFLDLSGVNNGNLLTQRRRVLRLLKVMDAYELETAPDKFACYVHGQGHSIHYESRQLIYGWMDKFLKSKEATESKVLTEEERAVMR